MRIFRRNCSGIVAIIGTAAEAEVVTAGVASLGGTPMPSDAIMRIQSMTKVTIAVAALRLIERGELGLDQPVDQEHLCANIFGPLGLADTALWVPIDKIDRLPAAHRHGPDGFVEAEPAAGGFYAGPPPFDVDHGELVSTARDFYRFPRALADDTGLISAEHTRVLGTDQVPHQARQPTASSRALGRHGLGFGVAVQPGDAIRAATAGRAVWAPTISLTPTAPSQSCSRRTSWAANCGP